MDNNNNHNNTSTCTTDTTTNDNKHAPRPTPPHCRGWAPLLCGALVLFLASYPEEPMSYTLLQLQNKWI